MSERSEEVSGVIPALVKLALGSERLNLYVTNQRIIVAHVGKRGAGAAAASTLLGRLSGAFEDLFKSGKESLGRQKLKRLSPNEILASDKENFAIGYADVVTVQITHIPGLTTMTMLTKDDKFEFYTQFKFDIVVASLVGTLGDKVTAIG